MSKLSKVPDHNLGGAVSSAEACINRGYTKKALIDEITNRWPQYDSELIYARALKNYKRKHKGLEPGSSGSNGTNQKDAKQLELVNRMRGKDGNYLKALAEYGIFVYIPKELITTTGSDSADQTSKIASLEQRIRELEALLSNAEIKATKWDEVQAFVQR